MSYQERLALAIDYAEQHPPQLQDDFAWPETESELLVNSGRDSKYAILHDASDDSTVRFTPGQIAPNEVEAKSLSLADFNDLYAASVEAINAEVDMERAYSYHGHEIQHLEAATLLGAEACRMSVFINLLPRVGANDKFSLTMTLSTVVGYLDTTKIGTALILSRPDKPSPNDLDDLAAMGYEGVDDVAARVVKGRMRSLYHLLPLSLDLSTLDLDAR